MSRQFVLIDHRHCGGAGCERCNERGTKIARVSRPPGLFMPSTEPEFESARERCPCYEGIPVNGGVSQCTHADAIDEGEQCSVERCPLVPSYAIPGEP